MYIAVRRPYKRSIIETGRSLALNLLCYSDMTAFVESPQQFWTLRKTSGTFILMIPFL